MVPGEGGGWDASSPRLLLLSTYFTTSISWYQAKAEVGVVLDEEGAAAVERLVLIQRSKPKHLHPRAVSV